MKIKKNIRKIICLVLVIIMLFSTSTFAIEVNDFYNDESIKQKYATPEEYYKDVYGIEFVTVEIDGVIYHINDKLEITADFIESIKENMRDVTTSIYNTEVIESTHQVESTHQHEICDTESAESTSSNQYEIALDIYDSEIEYHGEKYIKVEIDGESFFVPENHMETAMECDHYWATEFSSLNGNDPQYCARIYESCVKCGALNIPLWIFPVYINHNIITNGPYLRPNSCYAIYENFCTSTTNACGYNYTTSAGTYHTLGVYEYYLVSHPSACWEYVRRCTQSWCYHWETVYVQRNHDLVYVSPVKDKCQTCGIIILY